VKLVVDPFPGAVALPGRKVMIDGVPLRQIVREQSPRASRAQHVSDSVQDFPPLVLRGPPTALGLRDGVLDQRVLKIAQVTRVGRSFWHAPASGPQRLPSTF
jgi:hypothetical protein